jgi:hypothetical protein
VTLALYVGGRRYYRVDDLERLRTAAHGHKLDEYSDDEWQYHAIVLKKHYNCVYE